MNQSTFVIHAKQILTMPESAPLADYDPARIERRDARLVGLIEDGCISVVDGVIDYVGAWEKRPKKVRESDYPTFTTGVATPGWIDCHTHSVFAGSREAEFVLRNAGRPYVEILEAGGGILNTVDAVRQTSGKVLSQTLFDRILEFVKRGITHVEVKSGYGLSSNDERKCLLAISNIKEAAPCGLSACFLGAHAVPREHRDTREKYIDLVCKEMIPMVANQNLAAYCDVFCDRGAFDATESRRILETGMSHGLIPRIHADEITNAGAAQLAADIGAASADHLEHSPDDALIAMAKADVVGVLMPAVNLFLGTTDHLAPARKLLNAGGEVALATDFNPGSAMTQDLAMMMTLACTLYKMTPGEAFRAITIGAAKALRRDDIGRLRVGDAANITLLNVPNYQYVPYFFGTSHVEGVVYEGEFVYWTEFEDQYQDRE